MPREQIKILDLTFKSKADFKAYVKNLIYNDISLCDSVLSMKPDLFNILVEILKRHPDFNNKTKKMCDLKIVRDTLNKKAFKIMIINNDSTEIDISWHVAIDGKHKSDKAELVSALRSSIESQILNFKNKSEQKCVICSNTDNLHVDHIIHFDELVYNFITIMKSENYEIPNKFGELDDSTHRRCFLDSDFNFKSRWLAYHREHATFRILCMKCNLSRVKSHIKI
jgi:5-methylcytosine-specific restriction endonuclease McrA